MNLVEIGVGEKCEILEIGQRCERLADMGVRVGDEAVKMVDNGGGIILRVGDVTLALCKRISEKIIVRKA